MNHLLDINQLSKHDIVALIQRALQFKHTDVRPSYPNNILATLFYENSTRTRVSFELAARALEIPVINIDLQHSSESKGEIISDTLSTLEAMGINLFAIRHNQEKLPHALAATCKNSHIINAGDGKYAHPSQALLDFMTIIEHKPQLDNLKIAIVGDLRHSRVANSLQCIASLLGVAELVLVAPLIWQPNYLHYGRVTTSLEDGISNADVVICLRVQHERLESDACIDAANYRSNYGITANHLSWAKPDTMVMHPGPINRGVEIDSDIADGAQSYILKQVTNGVYMRMAILEALILAPVKSV